MLNKWKAVFVLAVLVVSTFGGVSVAYTVDGTEMKERNSEIEDRDAGVEPLYTPESELRNEASGSVPEGLNEEEWSDIKALYQQARYHLTPFGSHNSYKGSNPAHGLGVTFETGAVRVYPHSGEDWTWSLVPVNYGYKGYTRQLNSISQSSMDTNNVRYIFDDALAEWFINDEKGIEHGFTIAAAPQPRHDAPLLIEMSLDTSLKPRVVQGNTGIACIDAAGDHVLSYHKLLVIDAEGRQIPSRLLLSTDTRTITISIDDNDAVYPITVDPLITVEMAKLTVSDGEALDYFGNSISISGDTVIVGAYRDNVSVNVDQGSAYVFERDKGGADNWGEVKKLIASDGASDDLFGISVSISGDTVVVGAHHKNVGANSDQGSAYVFERNQGGTDNWGEVKKLIASDGASFDRFGRSVSIIGDTVVVGAHRDDVGAISNQGSAYVFERNWGGADNWGEVKKLIASDGAADDRFGLSVSINGDTIVIGAYLDDVGANSDQGSAYVFERNQGGADNWGEMKNLTASDGGADDNFGYSVSISGDTVVVGARWDDVGANPEQGSAYVFERNLGGADNWGEMKKLTASDGWAFDNFGYSISISGDTVVVGAWSDNVDANSDQGSAYVFERNQGGADNWGEFKKLMASDGAAWDQFGYSVSISVDTIVVGANLDDVGANADQGSAYVFERNQGGADNWGEVKKLTACNGAFDSFGNSVSVSGDTVVVGSYLDDVGANASQGSAYIFERNQVGANNWGMVKKLAASDGETGDHFGRSVSISVDTIVIGANMDNVSTNIEQGSAYVFGRNQGGADNWGEVMKLTASDGTTDDRFGRSVSISGDTVVVGASRDDVGANTNQGSAYMFERNWGGANNWGETLKLTANDGASSDRFGFSVSNSGDTVVVGAFRDNVGANTNQGSAYMFERNMAGVVKKLIASDGAADDNFGYSVSISGDTVVVGAYMDDVGANTNQGSAYVFERNQGGTNDWGEVEKLTASDGADWDRFGNSVSISVDTIVVGAWSNNIDANTNQGSAYVFERNQGGADNWGEVKKLLASDGAADDRFGYSVSISVDTIVIGAYYDDVDTNSDQGSSYVFVRIGNRWVEVNHPVASDGAVDDRFGRSVSISGDTVVIGAYWDDNTQGSAYVFERNQGGADNWGEVKKLIASDGTTNDYFGISVSIDVDTIVVGAYSEGNWIGAAYVFERNWGGADYWGEVKKLIASDRLDQGMFGNSVSISGEIIVIGEPYNDIGASNSQGSAYIFERNQGGWDNWGEVKNLTASDGAAGDNFGNSVSISGDTVIVGAFRDDIGASSGQGSAYVFGRNQGGADNWGEVKKLTASDGDSWDYFGSSVSISMDTIIAGADGKEAAYVFERNQGGADNWGEVKKLNASDGSADDEFGKSVSISVDTAVVGAYLDDVGANSDQGSAYVFERNQGGADNWGEVMKLNASDGSAFDNYSLSVSISGDTVVVGAPYDDVGANIDQGSAYIYYYDNLNTPPTITTDNVTTATEDILYSVDYDATDIDIWDTFTWTISYTDTDGWLTMDPGTGVLSGTPDNSDVGSWTINVTVDDGAGDIDWSNFTLDVYNSVPNIITANDTTADEDVLYMVDYDSDDDGQGTITWSRWTDADFLSIDPATGVLSGTPDNSDVGPWTVNVTVDDGNGDIDWSNFTLVVNNSAPIITTADDIIAHEDMLYSVDYNSDDDGQGTITWSRWTDADFLSIDPATGVLSGTPDNLDVGPWTVNVTVDDGNGDIDWSNFTLTVNNSAPIITTADDTTADEDVLYSVDYDSDDDGQGTITWSLWTDSDFLSINTSTGVLSGTPANSDVGPWTVNVTVDDGNGDIGWSNFTLVVNNSAPIITTADDTTADEDALYSVDYASDDDGQGTISWSLWSDSDFLTINTATGVLSGTPDNSDVGPWTVNVTVDDGNGGIDWNNFTLVVSNADPNILTLDDTTAEEAALYSVDYDSDDDGQGTIIWSLWTDSDFLSINTATGVLSGTPDYSDIGPWIVNVTVDDGNGGFDWSNFTLVVSITNNAPVIDPVVVNNGTVGAYYELDIDATDADPSDTLTWTMTSNATWLSIGVNNGTIWGKPTSAGIFWANITVNDGNGGSDWMNLTIKIKPVYDDDKEPDDNELQQFWWIILIIVIVLLIIILFMYKKRGKKPAEEAIEDRFEEREESSEVKVIPGESEEGPKVELNRAAGKIRFGDGAHGRIPPMGKDNVRADYRVGGGEAGNVEKIVTKEISKKGTRERKPGEKE